MSKLIPIPRPTETQLEELQEKHGDVQSMNFLEGLVWIVVRAPTRAEWRKFKDAQAKQGEARFKASEQLAASCTVYPAPEVLQATAEVRPALLESICGEVFEFAGLHNAGEKKTL